MSQQRFSAEPRYWVVVPAAGIGTRMGATRPKQYLYLHDKTILEHTLARLLQLPNLAGVYVALNANDDYWPQLAVSQDKRISCVKGGSERADSVLAALDALAGHAQENDWLLVHDAARPCITTGAIEQLYAQLAQHPVGGILAVPVSDTLKQVDSALQINHTLDRRLLWQAQTPQMFRLGLLRSCLSRALAEGKQITDESSALELYGYQPQIVEGRADNLKITRPEDLPLAQMILQQQETCS